MFQLHAAEVGDNFFNINFKLFIAYSLGGLKL